MPNKKQGRNPRRRPHVPLMSPASGPAAARWVVWPVASPLARPPATQRTGWFAWHCGRRPRCHANHLSCRPYAHPVGLLSCGDRGGLRFVLRANPEVKVKTNLDTNPQTKPFVWGFRLGRARVPLAQKRATLGTRAPGTEPAPGRIARHALLLPDHSGVIVPTRD
jgi:hypothetical protein